MIKKAIKKIFMVIFLITMILCIIVIPNIYADNNRIASVPVTKLKIKEQAKVNINLENIEYDISKIVIATDIYLEPLIDTASSGITVKDTDFDASNKECTITNIPDTAKSLLVSYTIPEYIANGTKIKITIIVYEVDKEKDKEKDKETFNITITSDEKTGQDNNKDNTNNQGNTVDNTNNINNGVGNNSGAMDNSQNSNTIPNGNNSVDTSNSSNMQASNQANSGQLSQMSSSIGGSSNTETIIYKGSRNNYLSSIEVSGYELTPEFNKTNSTYFITVSNDVTNISVNTVKEDSSASATISRK